MHLPPLDQRDRPRILMPRNEDKMNRRQDQHAHKDHRRPVEPGRRHGIDLRPEAPEEGPEGVQDRKGIDRDAELAEGELRGG